MVSTKVEVNLPWEANFAGGGRVLASLSLALWPDLLINQFGRGSDNVRKKPAPQQPNKGIKKAKPKHRPHWRPRNLPSLGSVVGGR